jgi:hypothetical protein
VKNVKKLTSLLDLYEFISERDIGNEDRKDRLVVVEERYKTIFELEKETNKEVFWHQVILTSELYYHYNLYSMHEKVNVNPLFETLGSGGYDLRSFHNPIMANVLVSMYLSGKQNDAILILDSLSPLDFIMRLKEHPRYFTPTYPTEQFVEFMIVAISKMNVEEVKVAWADAVASLISNNIRHFFSFSRNSQRMDNIDHHLEQLLELVVAGSVRYPFIEAIKHQNFVLIDKEDEEEEPTSSPLKSIIQKLTQTAFEGEKETILFYLHVFEESFREEFISVALEVIQSRSIAKWKSELLKEIIFNTKEKWDTLRELVPMYTGKHSPNPWGLEFWNQNQTDIWEEVTAPKNIRLLHQFYQLVTHLYISHRRYQSATDFLYSIEEKDEAVYVLLSNVYKEVKQYDDILAILQEANKSGFEVDELIEEIIELKEEADEEMKKAAAEQAAKMKTDYFGLEKLTRKILIILYELLKEQEAVRPEQILNVLRWKENQLSYLHKHLEKLVKSRMVQWDGKQLTQLHSIIRDLASKVADPKLEAQVVKASSNKLYKQVFFHESEMDLYRVLGDLFPQSHVFPNMSLQTIMEYEKLKPLVDYETFEYYLKTHVDFVIVNSFNYFPMIAIEKDSDYHDNPDTIRKDKMKNLLFQLSGIPLLRFRYNKSMDAEQLKRDVITATKPFILEHIHKDDHFSKTLIQSIDMKKFEVIEEVDIEKVKAIVMGIVGPALIDRLVILAEGDKVVLEIPKELFVLNHSMPIIERDVKREFGVVGEVLVRWV